MVGSIALFVWPVRVSIIKRRTQVRCCVPCSCSLVVVGCFIAIAERAGPCGNAIALLCCLAFLHRSRSIECTPATTASRSADGHASLSPI